MVRNNSGKRSEGMAEKFMADHLIAACHWASRVKDFAAG
jgi:hypothetical protein